MVHLADTTICSVYYNNSINYELAQNKYELYYSCKPFSERIYRDKASYVYS